MQQRGLHCSWVMLLDDVPNGHNEGSDLALTQGGGVSYEGILTGIVSHGYGSLATMAAMRFCTVALPGWLLLVFALL
jgi:hypothetical protein